MQQTASISAEFIRLEGIHKVYTRGAIDVPVLRGVSLAIARREMVALMGASGTGKTTWINLLGFLDRPTGGQYWLDGRDVIELSELERAWLRSRRAERGKKGDITMI
jgi:ABC-type lipoprotein export system ATPase subunit